MLESQYQRAGDGRPTTDLGQLSDGTRGQSLERSDDLIANGIQTGVATQEFLPRGQSRGAHQSDAPHDGGGHQSVRGQP